jgi:hypothetical protein
MVLSEAVRPRFCASLSKLRCCSSRPIEVRRALGLRRGSGGLSCDGRGDRCDVSVVVVEAVARIGGAGARG